MSRPPVRSPRPLLIVLGLLLVCATGAAPAAEFVVKQAASRLQDGSYMVDVAIDYRFSDTALEALENGVPLTVEVHIQVRREGAWIWEEDVVDSRLRAELRYHPLSALYEVRDLESGNRQVFATRGAALVALGDLSDVPVVREEQLEPGESYRMALKTSLDIEALPLPLRPLAYVSPSWNLSSRWTQWLLRP